jgi:hypothetical protein
MDDLAALARAELEQRYRTAQQTVELHRQAAKQGRRRTDPSEEDHVHEREAAGNGIEVGYKGVRAQVSGPLALLTAVFLVVGGASAYINYRGHERTAQLLERSTADHDLLSCVVSLSPEDRSQLRHARSRKDIRDWYCGWLRTD